MVLPPIAYVLTYRICLGLERHDREVLEHGIETGVIRRLPHGEFIEVHQPLGGVDAHGHAIPLAYQGAPVPKRMNQLGFAGAPIYNAPAAAFHDITIGANGLYPTTPGWDYNTGRGTPDITAFVNGARAVR